MNQWGPGTSSRRSDFPTVTQFTPTHVFIIPYMLKVDPPINYVSEEAAVIACRICDWAHFPDMRVNELLPVYFDGSIHDKPRQIRRDEKADDHVVKLGFYQALRFKNETVLADPQGVTDIIVRKARE